MKKQKVYFTVKFIIYHLGKKHALFIYLFFLSKAKYVVGVFSGFSVEDVSAKHSGIYNECPKASQW